MSLFKKATKAQSKLRLALIGPAGAGKTYSALAIGTELVPNGRVALIDTERGSASLYADRFSFDTLDLEKHSPDDYVEAINAAESEGYDVIVVDSLSHAWVGRDGALEQVDKTMKRSGSSNSFTAWRDVTPKHNRLVDAILSCRAHLVATIRSKTEYVIEKDERTGKSAPRKIGLAPVQRDGLDFEFTIVGDISADNVLSITKSRLSSLAGAVIEKPGAKLAHQIRDWLMSGEPETRLAPAAQTETLSTAIDETFMGFVSSIRSAPDLSSLDRAVAGPGKPARGTPEYRKALEIYNERKAALSANGANA